MKAQVLTSRDPDIAPGSIGEVLGEMPGGFEIAFPSVKRDLARAAGPVTVFMFHAEVLLSDVIVIAPAAADEAEQPGNPS